MRLSLNILVPRRERRNKGDLRYKIWLNLSFRYFSLSNKVMNLTKFICIEKFKLIKEAGVIG